MAGSIGQRVYVSYDLPMSHISFCHQSIPSHLRTHFLRICLTHHSQVSFPLARFSFPSPDASPALFLGTTVVHSCICRAQMYPWNRVLHTGEGGRLEWHHSWKTSRRWKMSMNSLLFPGRLNFTYVLVPNVIHKIFWTFRVAKPIGN